MPLECVFHAVDVSTKARGVVTPRTKPNAEGFFILSESIKVLSVFLI